MADDLIETLCQAWRTCVIATALLAGALAVAPYWSTAGYLQALLESFASPF